MPLNPVERRLLSLRGEWETFRAESSKRLLVWKVPSDALRLMQCFFEAQKQETEYTTGDLFIVFDAPFDNSIQYSKALKTALLGHYEASREELEQQGIPPNWQVDADAFPDTASGFVQMLSSFGAKHREHIRHLVAVLTPSGIANPSACEAWITRCLNSQMPEQLRIAVLDTQEAPQFGDLLRSAQSLIHIGEPSLDVLGMARESFSYDGAFGSAALFRNHLIDLAALLQKGSSADIKARALDAYTFARRNGWADQEVVVKMLVAGAFLKDKQFDAAVNAYRAARESAIAATAGGHPAGRLLELQTWFGEAGVRLAAADSQQAAQCYDECAEIAGQIPHLILAIEALRMSMLCHAAIDQRAVAIERGTQALAQAERLKPEARPMTTLPLAGVELLRLIEPQRIKAMEQVSHHLNASISQSREQAERRVTELESSGDRRRLRAVEQQLTERIALAQQTAEQELDAACLTADPQFREVYSKLRELLSERWPEALMESLATLSPAPRGKTGTPAK
jgi:hypothetical protein